MEAMDVDGAPASNGWCDGGSGLLPLVRASRMAACRSGTVRTAAVCSVASGGARAVSIGSEVGLCGDP